MTDRVRQLTITLDEDTRVDHLESIVSAIRQIRGVAIVEPHVVHIEDHHARMAVRADVQQKLHEAVDGVFRQHSVREKVKDLKDR
jgi:hypothetical protein